MEGNVMHSSKSILVLVFLLMIILLITLFFTELHDYAPGFKPLALYTELRIGHVRSLVRHNNQKRGRIISPYN